MNMLKRIRNRKGFTLVELMIVVAIIGILAAIAIPAFLRSVKKSKAAESEQIMRKFADGSKNYFTSEQRYSDPATGEQPWHGAAGVAATAKTVADRATLAGMPVPWNLYVFPGGDGCTLLSSPLVPTGGAKEISNPVGTGCTSDEATMNKLGVTLNDPVYFQYQYASTGTADTATVALQAVANFNTSGGTDHTATQNILVAADQDVIVNPMAVDNEFQ